jgi:magnesium-transporting ATPase (P-type)
VNLDVGLLPLDLQQREDAFGTNKADPPSRTPFCELFMGVLEDFMLRLLLVCAVISIGFDEGFAKDSHERLTGISLIINSPIAWIEGFAIFVAVFVVAIVGSVNDYKKEE